MFVARYCKAIGAAKIGDVTLGSGFATRGVMPARSNLEPRTI